MESEAPLWSPVRAVTSAPRLAVISLIVNSLLASTTIVAGWLGRSTSATAAGVELATDVLTAGLVLVGLLVASRPPDWNHPYGHGRAEILAGLVVGLVLVATGVGICATALQSFRLQHPPPADFVVWPVIGAVLVKGVMMAVKFRVGRRLGSAALVADGWNDAVDILSGVTSVTALALTLSNPERFLAADHFGGFAVGLIVIGTGLRVGRDTSFELMDTMPPSGLIEDVRRAAAGVEGVLGIEKCWARKTGFQYHVDIHVEVDPSMTVASSHAIAERVRRRITRHVPTVADVLVHIEPAP